MNTNQLNIKNMPDGIERKVYGATIGIVYRYLMRAVSNIHGINVVSK